MNRFSIALLVAASSGAVASVALAEDHKPLAGTDRSTTWTFDTSPTKGARTKKATTSQGAAAANSEEAARAARLAEARRKFFEQKPDGQQDKPIPEFGGYNGADAGNSGFRPGAQFKF